MDRVTFYPVQYDPRWKMSPDEELRDALATCRERHGIEPDIVLCSEADAAAVGAVAGVEVLARRYVAPHVWYPGKKPQGVA